MTIASRLKLNMRFSAAVVLLMMAAFGAALLLEQGIRERSLFAEQLMRGVFELSLLTDYYLRHPEARPKRQWRLQHAALLHLLKDKRAGPREQVRLEPLIQSLEDSDALFQELAGTDASGGADEPITPQKREQLADLLIMQSHAIAETTAQMAADSRAAMAALTRQIEVAFPVLALLALALTVWSASRIRNSIVGPIEQLRRGAAILGAGQLDYRIGLAAADELGQLAGEFDQMAQRLKTVTASREELRQEMAERQRAVAALQASKAKLEAALTSMTDAVFIADTEGRFIDFNDAFATFHRFRNKEECAKTLAEYPVFLEVFTANGERAPLEQWAVSRALRGETVANAEYTLRRKDTGETWVGSYSFAPIRDQDGAIAGAVVVGRDITEHKQAEEALRRSREDLDRAQAVGQIGWWRLDIRKNVLTWSPENHRIFGVPEGAPMSYEFFLSTVHPDDRQYVDTQWQAGLRGESYDIEHRIVAADGKVKWVREKAYLEFDGEGQLLGGFGITQDITARKEAEAALRASERRLIGVLESMPDAFVSFDADMRYTYVNANAERLQAAQREALLGKDVRVVYPDAESYKTISQYERVLREQQPVTLTSFHAGFDRWVEIRVFPTPDGVSVFYKDVSAQVKAEEALRASEEKYRNLFENMAEEVHFWRLVRDEAGNIKTWRLVDANPPALKTWGRQSVEEIRGQTIDEIFGPAATERYLPVAQAIFAAGAPYAFEDYFPNLDKHFRFASVPFGECVITTGADITPIKKAQEALRRSEARWNAAIESFAEGAIIATEDEQVIYWNPAARKMHGFTRIDEGIEPLEKTLATFQLWTPDGGHKLELDEWPMRRIKRGDTVRHLELRLRRLDQGWEKVFSYSGAMVATASGERLIFLTCHDLTELRKAELALREREARLRAIVHAVPDALLVLDEEGRYLEVLTDPPSPLYPDPTAIEGRLISDVLPAAVAQVCLNAIRQTLCTRRPQRFEYELAIGKAGQRAFEARAAPLEAPISEKPAVVLLARDVTQQRLTEASLHQAQKMEAIGQLTGGIAHDFNNLLAVILGNLEFLAEGLHDPALADLAQRALEATERGAELVRRLLAFARKQPLRVKAVDLNRLVAGMSDLLQRTLGETIQVKTVLAADLAQTVIDPGQFETALLNLAVNARDAMPNGGWLTIETANCTLAEDDPRAQRYPVSPGPYVMLAVSDTGGGMSPEVVEHAFEPFFTTKAVGQGSGLGLSMVYGLVKQSGGHLQLYSEVGQGTTLRMFLPAAPPAPAATLTAPSSEALPPTGQGQLILVVEDEAPVRRLAVLMLQSLGYQTLEAETAATALELLETTPQVALLFTDVVLPGGQSGVDLVQQARWRWPDLKVLFTSGYTEAHLTRFRRPLEDSKLLSKPYRKAQLADQVRALLGAGQPPPS